MNKGKIKKSFSNMNQEKIRAIHQQRRMFCIHHDRLWFRDIGSQESHTEWFISEGWMTEEGSDFINQIIRGYVNYAGDIYFYIGLDFSINEEAEKMFFKFLPELCLRLNIPPNAKIFGGLKVSVPGEIWPPMKEFGTVKELIG